MSYARRVPLGLARALHWNSWRTQARQPEFLKNFEVHRNVQLMFSVEPGNQRAEVLDVCHG